MSVDQVMADAARVRRELTLFYWVRDTWPDIDSLLKRVADLPPADLPAYCKDLPPKAAAILIAISKKEV